MTTASPDTRGGGGGQLGLVALSDFAVWLGAGMIYPYMPLFLTREADAPFWMIGVIGAAYFIAIMALSSPLGRLSDRLGRKPLMVAGTALYTVSTLLFLTTTDPWLFVLFRAVEGVGVAAVVPAAQAFVAEITSDARRSQAYGWLASAQFGGLIVGPLLAVPVYETAGGEGLRAFYSIFVVSAAITLIAAALLLVFLREPAATKERREAPGEPPPTPSYRSLLTRPVAAIIAVTATAEFSLGGFDVVWGLWLDSIGVSMRQIGITFAAFSVPMLLAFVGGYVADRVSRFALMTAGFAFQGVTWFLLPATEEYMVIIAILFLSGLAFAFAFPAKQAFLVQVSPIAWLGTIQGLEQTAMNLAATIGTLLLPFLYPWLGGWVFAIAGVVALAGVVWATPILRHEWSCIVTGTGVMSCADAERLLAVSSDGAGILDDETDLSRGGS